MAVQEKCPFSGQNGEFKMREHGPKCLKLKNWVDGTEIVDTLHQKVKDPIHCTNGRCTGSIVFPYGGEIPANRPYGVPRHKEEVKIHAKDFFEQCYSSINLLGDKEHQQRLAEVIETIEECGTYEMTEKELLFAAKTAWRNTPRCIGRFQWNSLELIDARHITTTQEMFEYLKKHLVYSTNGGNILPLITVFPQRKELNKDFRIWNSVMLCWAGYRQPDGTVIGDPANADFTEFCQSLGWKGKGGRFDILPLVLQANGGPPEFFEIPEDIVLQVKIKHPKFPWFKELGLKWFTVPVQTGLLLDAGGLEFTAAPSSAWYLLTEIGARDLGDPHRFNMLEVVAKKMGLDTSRNTSLWKDYAMVELNYAVLHSFQEAGVTTTDHHSATESFMKHMKKEMKVRGGCPSDWVWIVPPISGSATPVFHQEMLNYTLKPNFEHQPSLWESYGSTEESNKKLSFRTVAKAVLVAVFLMRKVMCKRHKATIVFATETGRAEDCARNLAKIMSHAFDVKVLCMNQYEHAHLDKEHLLLVVTSTYGNGESPENGTSFASYLESRRNNNKKAPLTNLKYSVFGLGSRLYIDFCAFGHYVDDHLRELGAQTILPMGEGDELSGQDESFRGWTKDVFKAACDSFGLTNEATSKVVNVSLKNMATDWFPGLYRWVKHRITQEGDLCSSLSSIYSKTVCPAKVISVTELQLRESSRSTILVSLDIRENSKELIFEPGDHVAIFPANRASLVQDLVDLTHEEPDPNWPIRIEVAREDPSGSRVWEQFHRFFVGCTLREALSRYLDITSVPTPQMLSYLAKLAASPLEKAKLETLSKGGSEYEDWALKKECNIVETLQEFTSVRVTADLLLTQLPAIQPRFFSISSSPDVYANEIHVTAVVVEYYKRGGQGPLHQGVCSKWLQELKPGDMVPCYIRRAQSFHLPSDGSVPVILVGNGTGIAPFRAFWQQRMFDMSNKCPPKSAITGQRQWGDIRLFFGCRNPRHDDIYRTETEEAMGRKVITELRTAYSREDQRPKRYVQDLLREDHSIICDLLLHSKARLYVCGSAAMAEDVKKTLQSLIADRLNLSSEEALKFICNLKSSSQYHEDVFSVAQRNKETRQTNGDRKQVN